MKKAKRVMKDGKGRLVDLRKQGFFSFIINGFEHRTGVKLPLNSKLRWKLFIWSEIYHWDKYFETKGTSSDDHEGYCLRLDSNLPLQEEVVKLLPQNKNQVEILDVGAGPLTYLGKVHEGLKINITAVDSLANEYDNLMKKYCIYPLIQTKKGDAEKLSEIFSRDSFDLVFARNCIDHSYSPEKAILEMIKVVKKNCYIFMKHYPNEAIAENYKGLHNWNFSTEKGDFIISSKNKNTNISQKYNNICRIVCTCNNDRTGEWLNTIILKL